MKNLRKVAAALLMLPVLALNANPLITNALPNGDASAKGSQQQATVYCWIIINGRWYYIPC